MAQHLPSMQEALGSIRWTQRELHRQNALAGEWVVMATWVTKPFVNKNGPLEGKIILAELGSSCSQAERPFAPSAPLRMTVSRGLSLSCQVAELRRAFNQQALWPAAPVPSPLKERWQAPPASAF